MIKLLPSQWTLALLRDRFLRVRIRLSYAFIIGIVSFAAAAPFSEAQTPPVRNVSELPRQSKPISDVMVPIPSEIFGSLDKFTNSNWRAVQLPALAHSKPHGDQTQIALLLGAVIAEGFIAVEAADSAEVKEIGSAVLTLARALGVERAVIGRSGSIMEYAEKDDWAAVRKEWDGVLPDVQQGMEELRSGHLSQLVSLGGWLRGTEALTALILQNYSEEGGKLLRQPALLDYFDKQLSAMDTKPSLSKMQEGVRKMRILVAGSGQPIPEKSVRDLAVICHELLETIDARAIIR